jgi:hypothetical protein
MKRDIPLGHGLRHHLRQGWDAVMTEVCGAVPAGSWATHGRDCRHTQTHQFGGISFLAVVLRRGSSPHSHRPDRGRAIGTRRSCARCLRLHSRHSAFITDGLEAGEPVMVAVSAQHTKWLRDALDGQADVEFVDIEQLGRNPAQIIPAWQ